MEKDPMLPLHVPEEVKKDPVLPLHVPEKLEKLLKLLLHIPEEPEKEFSLSRQEFSYATRSLFTSRLGIKGKALKIIDTS